MLGSCGLFAYIGEPDEIVLWGNELILSWDPPAATLGSPQTESYSLYYRPFPSFFGGDWTALGTVSARGTTSFHVDGAALEPGKYEFAVRSVDEQGSYSDYHKSTDGDADPPTGWYVNWLGGNP